MPDWQPDPEEARQAGRWPLRLLTAPGYFQSHAADLEDEADRAAVVEQAHALAVPEIACPGFLGVQVRPGNVLTPGQRPDSETVSGTINMLCSDRFTDIGEGATYQSTWLDIAAWPELPP